MAFYLAKPEDRVRTDWMARFDAAHWTLNFPRPMMASVTTTAADSLRVDLAYYKRDDLCGLIWDSVDGIDHPLLRYETRRDYRGMVLSFGWRSAGDVKALNVPNGAVMTIEGRDAAGTPQVWYVRLWNYAVGSVTNAQITLDFDDMRSGFEPGGDEVFAGDIDRMFISLTPEGFDGSDAPLAVPEEATVWLEGIGCEGTGSKIRIGDACIPPHELRIATGYDDDYNLTPERLLRNVQALGYRKLLTLYVGMSHFMRLDARAGGAFEVVTEGDPLVGPCRVWMEDLTARAAADDVTIIFSLSYELFDAYAPEAWKQRTHDGSPALTGWIPPSTLLSPTNGEAMAWLQSVAVAFADISQVAGRESWFQVGEPWWWTGFGDDQVPCFYDDATTTAYTAETGNPEPGRLTDLPQVLTSPQADYVAWLGGKLGRSVLDVMDAVKAAVPGVKTAMLFYAPQVLREDAPWLKIANMPAEFAAPAFDVLQLEDYDFVLAEDRGASRRAVTAIEAELGYSAGVQDYFSGFVLTAEARDRWPFIAEAARDALARNVRETFVWALPQVRRDGFTFFTMDGETDVDAFHDVAFPIALGEGASGGPEFLTQVAETISGHEQRSMVWAQGRLRYDAGPGIRSEADLSELVRFYRARKGQAHGFRLRDLLDHSSGNDGGLDAGDQLLGIGDGVRTDFALLKRYGEGEDAELRRITRPEAGTLRVAVEGSEVFGWTLEAGGILRFESAPTGVVTAGYLFDVPVRFADDRLEISLNAWRAGEVPSVPMVEIREA